MRTIETTVYQFDELTEGAKEKAREWWRGLAFSDSCDWEHVYEDADQCAAILGIEIDRRNYRTIGGKSGSEPAIYFSGFWSQGDGASFDGRYRYVKGAVKAIREHAPEDKDLHAIADQLQAIQKRHFYRLYSRISADSRGHWLTVETEDRENQYKDLRGDDDSIKELMRDFANWIYKQLAREYEYQTADEQVDDCIIANEYEFTEDGERA